MERKAWGSKRDKMNRVGSRSRSALPQILIVCEGTKTEPNYFKKFRMPSSTVKVVGLGYNTVSLVQETNRIRFNYQIDGTHYSQTWVVFDRDSFTPQQVSRAIQLASNYNIETAFSNEAFELWYLLHYDYITTGLSRTQYETMLTQRLGCKYIKNMPDMYERILHLQDRAIQNATRLESQWTNTPFQNRNPFTQVHNLVKLLASK